MTDRFNGLIVVLDRDIREDGAQETINAIRQIKGVIEVTGNVAHAADTFSVRRERYRIAEKLGKFAEELTSPGKTPILEQLNRQ